jgi:hypothetical protein
MALKKTIQIFFANQPEALSTSKSVDKMASGQAPGRLAGGRPATAGRRPVPRALRGPPPARAPQDEMAAATKRTVLT